MDDITSKNTQTLKNPRIPSSPIQVIKPPKLRVRSFIHRNFHAPYVSRYSTYELLNRLEVNLRNLFKLLFKFDNLIDASKYFVLSEFNDRKYKDSSEVVLQFMNSGCYKEDCYDKIIQSEYDMYDIFENVMEIVKIKIKELKKTNSPKGLNVVNEKNRKKKTSKISSSYKENLCCFFDFHKEKSKVIKKGMSLVCCIKNYRNLSKSGRFLKLYEKLRNCGVKREKLFKKVDKNNVNFM